MTNSDVATATDIRRVLVATPTFSPGGGTYPGSVTVTISDATSGATIHYTTDGSTPTKIGRASCRKVTITRRTTQNAKAEATGMTNRTVARATTTIQKQEPTP